MSILGLFPTYYDFFDLHLKIKNNNNIAIKLDMLKLKCAK